MITFILYFILVTVVFTLVIIEKNKYKTFYSPFIIFSVPYLTIISYQIVLTNIYGWKEVSTLFLIYVILYLVSFFLIGNLSMTFFNYLGKNFSYKKKEENTNFKFEKTYELKGANRLKLVEIISIISAIYLIVFFIYNMRDLSNIGMIVQPEFQRVYGSGFNFFLRLFCLIGTAYFLGLANKNNKRFFLWAALCFVPNFATFVQGIGFIAIDRKSVV